MRSKILVAALPLVLALGPGLALADPPPAAPPVSVHRDGMVVGFALGGGNMVPDCDGCDVLGGAAFEAHVGGMLSPNLALLFDVSNVAHPEDGGSFAQTAAVGALQLWVRPNTWVRAGLGVGKLTRSSATGAMTMMSERTGSALLLGAGIEILQRASYAVDVQARVVAVDYQDATMTNVAAFLGLSWF